MHTFTTPMDHWKLQVMGSGLIQVLPSRRQILGGLCFPQRKGYIFRRRIQNVGTTALKVYCINKATWPATTATEPVYATAEAHAILAAGAAADDGLGGFVEFDGLGCEVYIWTGTSAATAIAALTFESYIGDLT